MQRQAIFISWSTGRDGSVSVHERNVRFVKEMPNMMKGTTSTLNYVNRHELLNRASFTIGAVKPVRYGLESLSYLGPKCCYCYT